MILEHPLIPKHPDGKLRVIVPGRISTPHQDEKSIDASQEDSEKWLRSVYPGPIEFKRVGEQASGWLVDRPSMVRAMSIIENGQCDLVLVGGLRELFRNPYLIWGFFQACIDDDTRVISRWDTIDTMRDDWESQLHFAVMKNGMHVPETRRLVKRKATHSFGLGGMVMKIKFGYRKLSQAEADSGEFGPKGLRIAKEVQWTLTIQEIRRRVLAGHTDVMVADWLNAEGVPPGRYVTSGKWTSRVVHDLLTDPILSGQREFRKTTSRMVYKTGKHRAERNATPLKSEKFPELAHLTEAEHNDLIRYYAARALENRTHQKSGSESPLYKQRRSVSLWPGQSLKCSACQGKFYQLGNVMKCQHTLSKNTRTCWNHVIVNTTTVQDKVLSALIARLDQDPTAKDQLVQFAWKEYQTLRHKSLHSKLGVEGELAEITRQIARLVKALKQDAELKCVVTELSALEKKKKSLMEEKAKQASTKFDLGEYASADFLASDLPQVLGRMVKTSRQFALLLRQLVKECVIVPVQDLDRGQVRPRLTFTISFAAWSNSQSDPWEKRFSVDLFEPPVHILHMKECLEARRQHPGKTLKQLGDMLGIGHMTVKRSLDYARRMESQGATEPYRILVEAPAQASRWKSRRTQSPSNSSDPPPATNLI